jgi:uracil-DNA glycosylase
LGQPASVRLVRACYLVRRTLEELRDQAKICTRCELWSRATQTVFGEGRPGAPVLLVGEQPGDREDREGRPFVGPAGRLLDGALSDAGIDRTGAYVTNVVKHFNWIPRGKRRMHSKPNAEHIAACLPWLEAEIAVIQPKVVVCLGATAAQALLGPAFRVTVDRGRVVASRLFPRVVATVHPSSILRAIDPQDRAAARERFVADLAVVAALVRGGGGASGPSPPVVPAKSRRH